MRDLSNVLASVLIVGIILDQCATPDLLLLCHAIVTACLKRCCGRSHPQED